MAWLAAVVDWQGADRSESVRVLVRPESWQVAVSHGRGPITSWGHARGEPDPVHGGSFEQDGVVALLDGRLDNELEIRSLLGERTELSGSALVASAYRRWGDELCEKLL